ncbi:LysR family transcriptional regulator [Aminobacter aganoensis]|uniref:DNA-binding transcriptional LysR family regulator n=1 Tax=Aminobacter aganoensis TaxID=83264 RepID=A0A7X0FAS9_9HYPH|nr:LysR family transcriptional regulator [Aminobacter aganoensis]MBB6356286.1 DNA-binding transcriptional LysR family regulator [Aminobacter aganoensis]
MASARPPLNWLRAFEAAARLGSFAAAGAELNVTPSAISQHIRALELRLGKELFDRHANGVRLTDRGRRYAEELGRAFALIDEATARIAGRGTREMLVVHVPTSFASQCIAPRLDLFRTQHPTIDLRLTALDHGEGKVDAAIEFGLGNWPKREATLLMRDQTFPVCTPAYAANLRSPDDLKAGDLLHVPGYDEDWDSWLAHVGVTGIDTSAGSFFDQSIMGIRAAVEGKGVLMGRTALIERELASGLLVAPFEQRLQGAGSYWFLATPQKAKAPKVMAFRDWLMRMTAPAETVES